MVTPPASAEPSVRTLILIRHARTASNARRVVSARDDEPLSTEGERQCSLYRQRLAADLTSREYLGAAHRIYSSPLARARQSAAAIAAPVECDPRLTEIDTGDLAGKTWEEIGAKYPDYFSTLDREEFGFRNPAATESFGEATDRLESFARERLAQAERVVAMTHADLLRLFACKVIGLHPGRWNNLFVANLGFMVFELSEGAFSLRAIINPSS